MGVFRVLGLGGFGVWDLGVEGPRGLGLFWPCGALGSGLSLWLGDLGFRSFRLWALKLTVQKVQVQNQKGGTQAIIYPEF